MAKIHTVSNTLYTSEVRNSLVFYRDAAHRTPVKSATVTGRTPVHLSVCFFGLEVIRLVCFFLPADEVLVLPVLLPALPEINQLVAS